MNNIDLLDRVLPSGGWYAVLGIKGKSVLQELVQTREEVAEYTQKYMDAGRDVYFGCSKFATNENRTKDNVLAIKSFWLDIDCGEKKAELNSKTGRPDGYIDQATGLQALRDFCNTIGLPKPILVNSGRGIHAYWPLTNSVTRQEWEPVANRLNELCVIHKFYVDAQVFEAARILRIPNTKNFKDDPAHDVVFMSDATEVEFEAFKQTLGVKEKAFVPTANQGLSELAKALAANTAHRFAKIMQRSAKGEGCKQLLDCYQSQETISEPRWFNALSIAQHCVDRDTAIHMMSEKYPEYCPDDTEQKASNTKYPNSCATFEKNNPGGCDGCPWKGRIKSPISLGREVIKAETADGHETENEQSEDIRIPEYPFPFFRAKNGGVYVKPMEEEAEPVCLYPHDLYVVKHMDDPDEGVCVLMHLRLPHEGLKEFTIPLAHISASDKVREALAKQGVAVGTEKMKTLASYVMASVAELQCKRKAEKMRTQFGWADNDSKFIVGNQEITKDGIFHSPPSHVTKEFAQWMVPKGTLEKWKEVFNMYAQPGLEPHAFAALTGFGSPLLKFTGHSGAIINVIHKSSGTGKSTSLYMCNSIFGHPDKMGAIWKDTAAAKFIMMGVYNNLAFTMDEITNTSPAEFSNLAYAMSQGRGANRAKASANELRVNNTTWAAISLCSANASFYEKLGFNKNSPDGEMMRLLEYQIEPSTIIDPATAKKMFDHQLKENYGHAGIIYAQYLVNNLEEALQCFHAVQERIDREMKLTSRERFWSAVIAANLTGGLIARNLGLIDFDMRAIYDWAMKMLAELRQDVVPPANDSASIIGDFLNRHMRNALIVDGYVDTRTKMHAAPLQEPYGDLLVRYEPDSKRLYISAKAFRDDCVEAQIGYKDTLKELKDKGIFLGAKNTRMSKGMRITSPGIHALMFDCNVPDFLDMDGLVESLNAGSGDSVQD
jgi:hypothetical protein